MYSPRFLCKWNESESQRIPNCPEIFAFCVGSGAERNINFSSLLFTGERRDCLLHSQVWLCRPVCELNLLQTHTLGKSKQTLLLVLMQCAVHWHFWGYCNASCGKGLFVYLFSRLAAAFEQENSRAARWHRSVILAFKPATRFRSTNMNLLRAFLLWGTVKYLPKCRSKVRQTKPKRRQQNVVGRPWFLASVSVSAT